MWRHACGDVLGLDLVRGRARVRVAAQQHAFFGFRHSKMTRATMNTFKLPSFAAPGFHRMKMARATTSTMMVVAAAVVAWRGGRAPPGTRSPSPAPRPVARPQQHPAPRRSRDVSPKGRRGAGGARVRVAARRSTLFFCPLKGCVRRVLYVLALHVSTATVTGPAAPTRASNVQRARNDKETVDEETMGGVGMGAVGGRPRVVAARMC